MRTGWKANSLGTTRVGNGAEQFLEEKGWCGLALRKGRCCYHDACAIDICAIDVCAIDAVTMMFVR